MKEERGLNLCLSTIYRWVQHYGPEIQKKVNSYSIWWMLLSIKLNTTHKCYILDSKHGIITVKADYLIIVNLKHFPDKKNIYTQVISPGEFLAL
ncbi:hypothetical protein [Candidatus Jidaibacter acanthamoebae]|nr:hypothetical protein [Candidatus Jidaibacter acanthamoeba]